LFEELENKPGMAKVLSNIGVVYWYQSNFPQSAGILFDGIAN
jgi:hypothetical protein